MRLATSIPLASHKSSTASNPGDCVASRSGIRVLAGRGCGVPQAVSYSSPDGFTTHPPRVCHVSGDGEDRLDGGAGEGLGMPKSCGCDTDRPPVCPLALRVLRCSGSFLCVVGRMTGFTVNRPRGWIAPRWRPVPARPPITTSYLPYYLYLYTLPSACSELLGRGRRLAPGILRVAKMNTAQIDLLSIHFRSTTGAIRR